MLRLIIIILLLQFSGLSFDFQSSAHDPRRAPHFKLNERQQISCSRNTSPLLDQCPHCQTSRVPEFVILYSYGTKQSDVVSLICAVKRACRSREQNYNQRNTKKKYNSEIYTEKG